MGRWLVPAAMVSALLSMATAALTVAAVPDHPAWWRAAAQLAVLGGMTPMIYAVNIRIVPVFSRRSWASARFLRAQVICAVAGAWLTFGGRLIDRNALAVTGQALALAAGVLFTINIIRLFRRPAGPVAPPLPYPEQASVDRVATRFTRISAIYLLVGLTIGFLTERWSPDRGRWDLVWAHAMLLGFVMTMISGVSYHVLARWTTKRWRSVAAVRLHFGLTAAGLPLMLIALALDSDVLFTAAGPVQTVALLVYLINTLPLVNGLPALSRAAWIGAACFLAAGVSLGAAFAFDPAMGARLRMAHAEINVFGWTGLLMSAVAYYLVPRFAGCPLRWPRLAPVQVGLLLLSVAGGSIALAARGYGKEVDPALALTQLLAAAAFGLLGAMVGGTFLNKPGAAVAIIAPRRPAPGGVRSVPRP